LRIPARFVAVHKADELNTDPNVQRQKCELDGSPEPLRIIALHGVKRFFKVVVVAGMKPAGGARSMLSAKCREYNALSLSFESRG